MSADKEVDGAEQPAAPGAGAIDAAGLHAAASRGRASVWWRFGQDRRFGLIRAYAHLDNAIALDLGCGLGRYTERMRAAGATAVGLEIEMDRARAAAAAGIPVAAGVGESVPAATFDTVLLHEVLEHVADDALTLAEVSRVLRPGGRCLVFVPNRGWPFETHGVWWRGRYRFGNAPLVNYLPDPLRNRLAPHVRVYTLHALLAAAGGLPLTPVVWLVIYPGYDKLAARWPRLGALLRRVTYGLERTPLHRFGLSHFLVLERQ
jgi:SAM-dependent methyltransferase